MLSWFSIDRGTLLSFIIIFFQIIAIRTNLLRPGWIQQKVCIRSLFDVFQTLFYL